MRSVLGPGFQRLAFRYGKAVMDEGMGPAPSDAEFAGAPAARFKAQARK